MAVIAGTVLTTTGQPVAEARAYYVAGPVPLPDIAALTDAAGRFFLEAPAPGSYRLECAAEGFESAVAVAEVVEAGREVGVEITLRRSGREDD